MTLCQLNEDMKQKIQEKLYEIQRKVNQLAAAMESKDLCLLCEITTVKDMALELDGLASFYHFRSSLIPNGTGTDEIARSLAKLSRKRHGALLAIEQNDTLDPYIAACSIAGVPIGADVSAPLLQSIFYPGNPLHDGAVIIREGRIMSAGCIFPLSDKKRNSSGRKIGTRHRAALGLSEKTDAVILVVSEETGEVSFVQNGIMHPIEISICPGRGTTKEPEVKLEYAAKEESTTTKV